MNKQATQVLHLGILFGIIAVFSDFLFGQLAPMNWIALEVSFLLIAASILMQVAGTLPKAERSPLPAANGEDEFQLLGSLVERVLVRQDQEASAILYRRLRALAVAAVATKTRQSNAEVRELAENDPAAIKAIVTDPALHELLTWTGDTAPPLGVSDVADLLSRIEVFSR